MTDLSELEDMSDLDKQLFGSGFSNKESKTGKKTVKFNDPNDDDILGDLLSDNEDFPKRQTATKNTKLADLFGLKTDVKSNLTKPVERVTSESKVNSESQRKNIIKSIFSDTAKPVDSSETKMSHFTEDVVPKSRPSSVPVEFNETKVTDNYSPTRKREPRRRRGSSVVLDDPLGLFSDSGKQTEKIHTNQEPKVDVFIIPKSQTNLEKTKNEDLPDWLGGTTKTDITKVPNVDKKVENLQTDNLSIFTDMQTDVQASVSLFQQYEQLGNILESQRIKLLEQEKQFEQIVKKQVEGQALLDTQLKMQHGRFNNFLQSLLVQSSVPNFANKSCTENLDKQSEAEILAKKLQTEKVYLEKTFESIKEKHEKEISMLEEIYSKQIQYLEDSLEKVEGRLKKDSEMLEENFEIRMQQMKDKMFELEKVHEEEKEQIRMDHKKQLQEICERHSRNIEVLQKEHADAVENISKTKKLEQTAIDLITTRGADVAKILENSETAISSLILVQKQMEEQNEKFFETKEGAMKKQANQLEFLKEQLLQEKEQLESDRKMFTKITQKVESDMSLMASEFRSRMTQLMEAENNLKLRESALIRDRELLMEQTKWEHSSIQTSKEMWDKEQARQTEAFAKERENIAIERGKLQLLNKLHSTSDEIDKVELESSIKAAKEATQSIIRERKMWQERCAELETQRDILLKKENELIRQAKYLEDLTQLSLLKRNEGMDALKKARRIEQTYKEKFQQLQVQLDVLNERENKIAAEKISLAKERLNLRAGEIDLPEKDEKPSKIYKEELFDRSYLIDDNVKPQIRTHFQDIVDPKLLLLKINLNNKLTEYE